MTTICLNMIVKNESHIILSTLQMLSKYIHYWVISDTGSTDNTREIITNYFKEVNIPGELYQDEWEDFGTNRTKSIERAYNKCDYIWVFDADDSVVGELIIPDNVDKDGYLFQFGNEDFLYNRPLLLKSNLKWIYKCVLHEYVHCCDKINVDFATIDRSCCYVKSGRLGSRNNDPNKYLNDANTLIKGIEKDAEHKLRYMYYIGQSYKDHGDLENAAIWYQKRSMEDGWIEEKYYSAFEYANCLVKLNKSVTDVTVSYNFAHKILPYRREAIFHMGIYLKTIAMNNLNIQERRELLIKVYDILLLAINLPLSSLYTLFIQLDIYTWKNKYELASVSNLLGKYSESIKLCNELLYTPSIRENILLINVVEKLKFQNISFHEKELIQYPKEMIHAIIENTRLNTNKEHKLTLTITTSKYEFFVKTINSLLNCCKDCHLIDRWICIDDNPTEEDRDDIKFQYPFFEFYYKTLEENGNLNSMNIIQSLVKTPYILHLEEGWLFIKKDYIIQPALHILDCTQFHCIDKAAQKLFENQKHTIAQVLFNVNYHKNNNYIINGGFMIETTTLPNVKCVLHEYYPPEDISTSRLSNLHNMADWPYFSLKPSIFKREIFDTLGPFKHPQSFEKNYAVQYYLHGYLSCFYDKILTTYYKNEEMTFMPQSKNKYFFIKNADSFGNDIAFYENTGFEELSKYAEKEDRCVAFNTYGYLKESINQNFIMLPDRNVNSIDGLYINKNKLNSTIYCINLERRQDRKAKMISQFESQHLNYNIVAAVDGSTIKPTPDIIQLFQYNDNGCSKGSVGCALSHIQLWKQLVNDPLKQYYIIMEDDVELHPKYNSYLKEIQDKLDDVDNWDILYLGYLTLKNNEKYKYISSDVDIQIIPFDYSNYIGGSHNYIISKNAAHKLLQFIKENSIYCGIDYIIIHRKNIILHQLQHFIVNAKWVTDYLYNEKSQVDSDIQYNTEYIDIYSDDDFQYIRSVDMKGYDICRKNVTSIRELKLFAMEDERCVCFNTLGELKYFIDVTKLEYNTSFSKKRNDNGIYVKRKYIDTTRITF
jgi:GR25 family glycosyltransferase involved in LPS biosynthesis